MNALDIHAINAGRHIDKVAAEAVAAATKAHGRLLPSGVVNAIVNAIREMAPDVAHDNRHVYAAFAQAERERQTAVQS